VNKPLKLAVQVSHLSLASLSTMVFPVVMLSVYDFSEAQGGNSCIRAVDICENIFDRILDFIDNINVSNNERTIPS